MGRTFKKSTEQNMVVVSIAMPPQERDAITDEAKYHGLTRSAFVRKLWSIYQTYKDQIEAKETQ